jgi:prepilin-type N-terminal cleavage/methylation domain-containing protein
MSATLNRRRHRINAAADDDGVDGGFTLLEVVVSFAIFATVMGGAMYGITSALQASHGSQQRVAAANVAQSFIAQAQANAATIAVEVDKQTDASSGKTTGVSKEEFIVHRWITFGAGGATQCSVGTTFTVSVVVDQAQTGKFLARSDSVVACPPA